jgi:hypothetical protein
MTVAPRARGRRPQTFTEAVIRETFENDSLLTWPPRGTRPLWQPRKFLVACLYRVPARIPVAVKNMIESISTGIIAPVELIVRKSY